MRWSRAGEGAHAQPSGESGLPDQDASEGTARIEVGVGEETELLELLGGEQMRLIDDEDDPAMPLGLLRGQQVTGLGDELGLAVAGDAAEGGDDGDVETAGAEGGVGDVDHLVAGSVQPCHRGAHRHRLAGADVADDDPEQALGDAEADPRHRLGVSGPGEEIAGGDGLAERHVGEVEVGDPRCPAHRSPSGSTRSR